MGEPYILLSEFIGEKEPTRGSEPSQYPEEKKTTCDSASSGERKRKSLNQSGLLDWGRGTRHNGRERLAKGCGKAHHRA